MVMKNILSSVAGLAVVVTACLVLIAQLGVIDFKLPWQNPKVHSVEKTVIAVEEPTIVEIEPIALDCRARIHTVVPLEGRREHKALGQVYRTDTVTMEAVGDIDTCVQAGEIEIINRDDGTVRVIIPADAITFERPRVDAIATYDSVTFDKGVVGKLTDVMPWVSEDNGLTPAGYAYAQSIIGSSACNELAFEITKQAIVEAFADQVRASGRTVSDLDVDIVGEPTYDANPQPEDLEDFDFTVGGAEATCAVASHARDGATVTAA